jgi:hypothetical protein
MYSVFLPVHNRKTIQNAILKILQKHIDGRGLLNASQFDYRTRHNTTLHCMRKADHVNLNFNNKMSAAVVFFDIEIAFFTTWHTGLLYILKFSNSLFNLICSFLSHLKCSVSMEHKISTIREMQVGIGQRFVFDPNCV